MPERKRHLLLRRLVQLSILAAFAAGPWLGARIAQGTLASSLWFGWLPLSDPFVLLQSLVAGHPIAAGAVVGGLIIALFYAVIGGRAFCGWVCPVNMVTDSAQGLRRALGWRKAKVLKVDKRLRYWVLAAALLLSLAGGVVAWELLNPINAIVRALVFGLWAAGIAAVVAIFLFDFLLLSNGWCGHVCPVGAFYGLAGRPGLVRIAAVRREACNDCGDCFNYCPEPQVIGPALRGTGGHGIHIRDADCLRCGRCIDVCEQQVFAFDLPAFARREADPR